MKDIRDRLTGLVKVAVGAAGFGAEEVIIEHPGTMGLGDYATAVAFKIAKREGNNPREVAEKIMEKIDGNTLGLSGYELQITGGSDKSGFPMRRDIEGVSTDRERHRFSR